jgi:hypothetical protein
VRALVAHGGAFRHTGLGGMWSYVGGAQKLVGVPKHASIADLQVQLTGQPVGSTSSQVSVWPPVLPVHSRYPPQQLKLLAHWCAFVRSVCSCSEPALGTCA